MMAISRPRNHRADENPNSKRGRPQCVVLDSLNHQQVNIEVPKIMEPGPHKISATQPRSHDYRSSHAYLDAPGEGREIKKKKDWKESTK
jgi:hypothetical protein